MASGHAVPIHILQKKSDWEYYVVELQLIESPFFFPERIGDGQGHAEKRGGLRKKYVEEKVVKEYIPVLCKLA